MSAKSAPLSIPALPSSSTTTAQTAYVASLTTQLEELVEKNARCTSDMDILKKDSARRLNAETQRGNDAVRRLRQAHQDEVQKYGELIETLRVSAVHAQRSIEYAHGVSKHELVMSNLELRRLKQQSLAQSALLTNAKHSQRVLQAQLRYSQGMVASFKAELMTAQETIAELTAQDSEQEGAAIKALKIQLAAATADLRTSKESLSAAEKDKIELQTEIEYLQKSRQHDQTALKAAKQAQKDAQSTLDALEEERSDSKRQDGANQKEKARRIRELEVSLAASKSRSAELESEKATWDQAKTSWGAEKAQMAKDIKRLERQAAEARSSKGGSKVGTDVASEIRRGDDKENQQVKNDARGTSKKRAREDFDDSSDANLAKTASEGPAKKRKMTEATSAKDKPKQKNTTKPSKVTSSGRAKASKPIESPCSPPPPSPSHVSTPSVCEDEAPQTKKPAPKEKRHKAEAATIAKRGGRFVTADSDSDGDGDGDVRSKSKAVTNPKERTSKVATQASKKTGKTKTKPSAGSDEEENFDVDAISDVTDDASEPDIAPPKHAKAKQDTKRPKNAEENAGKPTAKATKKPTAPPKTNEATQDDGREKNAVKPKPKKTFNLLGNFGTGTGATFGDWPGGRKSNPLGIPSELSSPEKGETPAIPRARFEFGRRA